MKKKSFPIGNSDPRNLCQLACFLEHWVHCLHSSFFMETTSFSLIIIFLLALNYPHFFEALGDLLLCWDSTLEKEDYTHAHI